MILCHFYIGSLKILPGFYDLDSKKKIKIIFYRIVNPTKSRIIFLIYCNMLHIIFLYCGFFTKPDSDFKVFRRFLLTLC